MDVRRALVLEASSWSMLTALGPSLTPPRGVEDAEEPPLAVAVLWFSSGMVWPHLDSSTCSSRSDATHTNKHKHKHRQQTNVRTREGCLS